MIILKPASEEKKENGICDLWEATLFLYILSAIKITKTKLKMGGHLMGIGCT
jgi:hypothetical protein